MARFEQRSLAGTEVAMDRIEMDPVCLILLESDESRILIFEIFDRAGSDTQ